MNFKEFLQNNIVMLDGGMVVAVGNHDTLMQTSPIYQEVYYSQQKGGDE